MSHRGVQSGLFGRELLKWWWTYLCGVEGYQLYNEAVLDIILTLKKEDSKWVKWKSTAVIYMFLLENHLLTGGIQVGEITCKHNIQIYIPLKIYRIY